jgi:hypothetical protein
VRGHGAHCCKRRPLGALHQFLWRGLTATRNDAAPSESSTCRDGFQTARTQNVSSVNIQITVLYGHIPRLSTWTRPEIPPTLAAQSTLWSDIIILGTKVNLLGSFQGHPALP